MNSCSAAGDIILLCCYNLIFNGNCVCVCGGGGGSVTFHWSFSTATLHYPHDDGDGLLIDGFGVGIT